MTQYYIWSHRHNQWWGPDRAGYSNSLAAAGVYIEAEAADIALGGMPGANVPVDTRLADRRLGTMETEEVVIELEALRRI